MYYMHRVTNSVLNQQGFKVVTYSAACSRTGACTETSCTETSCTGTYCTGTACTGTACTGTGVRPSDMRESSPRVSRMLRNKESDVK